MNSMKHFNAHIILSMRIEMESEQKGSLYAIHVTQKMFHYELKSRLKCDVSFKIVLHLQYN